MNSLVKFLKSGFWLYHSLSFSGTREAAFIHAITAAGLSSAVTEACAQGKPTHCSCDNTYRSAPSNVGWRWGGCSRDFKFGLKFSENFVDENQKGKRNPRRDMNRHNNGAGREVRFQSFDKNSLLGNIKR